jgi:leucine dehydrogenase
VIGAHGSEEFERMAVERGERSGALLAVAVHSTLLGPALGGARMWHYGDDNAAIEDAMRLGRAMTLKAAAAGLALGGGKGVIALPRPNAPEGEERRALLLDFGDLVESLGGSYVTAEDVGTGPDDMAVIAERTPQVVGRDPAAGGSGDPSPITALGVLAAIRAAVGHRFVARRGPSGLCGLRVTVIGVGHVGSELARLLVRAGARVTATDIDPDRRAVVESLGARWIEPEAALTATTDVLAPCALGGILDEATVGRLRCAVVCGAANNVLTGDAAAMLLANRGIVYVPDFIANAGGLISVSAELYGGGHDRTLELARGIEGTVAGVLDRAAAAGTTPLAAALALAEERLAAAHRREPAKLAG